MPFQRPDDDNLDEVQDLTRDADGSAPDASLLEKLFPGIPARAIRNARNIIRWGVIANLSMHGFFDTESAPKESLSPPTVIRLHLDDPKYDLDLPEFHITPADIKDLAKKPESIKGLPDAEFEALSNGWEKAIRDVLNQQPTIPWDAQNHDNEHMVHGRQVAEILSVNNESIKRDLDSTHGALELQKKINDYLKLKGFYLARLPDEDQGQVQGTRYMLAEIVGTDRVAVTTPNTSHSFPVFKLKLASEDSLKSSARGSGDQFSKDIVVFPKAIDETVPPQFKEGFYRDIVNHEAAHLRTFELFTAERFFLKNVNFEVPIGDSWVKIKQGLDKESFHEVIAHGAQMGRTEINAFQNYLQDGDNVIPSYQLYNSLTPYLVLQNAESTQLSDHVLGQYYATGTIDKGDAFAITALPIDAFKAENLNAFGLDMYRLGMAIMTEGEALCKSQQQANPPQ